MASDRARISYDPTRAYRTVVAQQGRVTLEADVNEASLIESEALRLETIDIVGAACTPSVPAPGDGYKVVPGATAETTVIHDGIYYLGGWRLELDQPVAIGAQPDWADRPTPPETRSGNDLVSLLITEQSVCAVEDQALRDVALGGPDSAARLRLLQRFLLLSMDGETCAAGAKTMGGLLVEDGVKLDPYSNQLVSSATLQVGFVPNAAPPDPCTPAAAGGYLGADNQLIRVTVSAFDPKAHTGNLLWGWNNASFLYRATLTDKAAGVFTLTAPPIDQEHAPQLGQAVEILRIRARLDGSDFIAADAGFVTTVKSAYAFDTGTFTITDGLDPGYLSDPGPFFVRLWQAIVPFNAGQPAALDTTSGLTATIALTALPTHVAARPFWRFAVRPFTPVQVYPRRYLDTGQPPDGPRQWLCELGVIGPGANGMRLLADCRPKFTPLADQTGGCCGLTLDPAGVDAHGGLQAVIDSLAGGPAVLSLQAGDYILPAPLLLTGHHKRLTIEGCTFGASIRANPDKLAAFTFGLIVIDKTDAITLRRLELDVPMVPARGGGTVAGVLVGDAGLVTIEDCAFGIQAPHDGRVEGTVFGGAVAIVSRVVDLTIRRNLFVGKHIFETGLVCGVLAAVNTDAIHTALVGADISGNDFERLSAAVFAYAHLGEIRCNDNRVKNCATGLFFSQTRLGALAAFERQAATRAQENAPLAAAMQAAFPAHTLGMIAQSKAAFLSHLAPLAGVVASKVSQDVLRTESATRGEAAFAEIAAAHAKLAAEAKAVSPATLATTPADTAKDARASARAAKAAETAKAAEAKRAKDAGDFVTALGHVETVALAAELAATKLTAALHLHDNDITLHKLQADAKPGVGIGLLMSPGDDAGMVLMSGNRVTCPDNRTVAGSVLFPAIATITGNLLVHPAGNNTGAGIPVFVAATLAGGAIAIAGNVFRSGAFVSPARTAPPPSPDWAFLNTEV